MSNNYPPGAANDSRAPWNETDEEPIEYEPEYEPEDDYDRED